MFEDLVRKSSEKQKLLERAIFLIGRYFFRRGFSETKSSG
jgi:hypothetical protein